MNMAVQTNLTDDQSVEQEIVAKGKTAPRVTLADIEAAIVGEVYFTGADAIRGIQKGPATGTGCIKTQIVDDVYTFAPCHLLTFCVLVLRNGFTVTGESACASPENFDAAIGRKIARQNAVQKIWPLMGYALKDRLSIGDALNPVFS
jgi:hypothetical protein